MDEALILTIIALKFASQACEQLFGISTARGFIKSDEHIAIRQTSLVEQFHVSGLLDTASENGVASRRWEVWIRKNATSRKYQPLFVGIEIDGGNRFFEYAGREHDGTPILIPATETMVKRQIAQLPDNQ